MAECKIDGCSRRVKHRDWCQKCYLRLWRTGAIEVNRYSPIRTLDDLLGHTRETPERYPGLGPCMEWTRSIASTGYGSLRFAGRTWNAHRLAYELAHGTILSGLCVTHRCDNRPCINPAHLHVGTRAENNGDKARRTRR